MASFAVSRSYIRLVCVAKNVTVNRDTYLMIIAEKLVQEIDSLVAHESLVLRGDEAMPRLLLETAENVVVLRVKLDLILIKVVEQVVSAENLGNLYELVGVALSMEERFLAENHGCEHCAQAPHI